MTALAPTTAADTRHPSAPPRLTRWLLRLHRPALYVWAGLVIVLSAALLWLGGPLTDAAGAAWEQYNACGEAPTCVYDQPSIIRYKDVYSVTTFAVLTAPFLVAAWWRHADQQGAGDGHRSADLDAVGVPGALAHRQARRPGRPGRHAAPACWSRCTTSPGRPEKAASGPPSPGPTSRPSTRAGSSPSPWPSPGLVVGVLVGLLWHRSLPALATSVAATAGAFTLVNLALPHLWPSVTRVTTRTQGAPSGGGLTVEQGILTSTGARLPDPYCGGDVFPDCRATYDGLDAVGYYHDYHPFSHYWPLQLTATALTLAIGALLVFAAFRVLRIRTGGAPRRGRTTAV